MTDLFNSPQAKADKPEIREPLAARMRPRTLDEIGRELPPFIAEAFAGEETRAGAHAFDRSDGRPPPLWRTPRLQLVTTARLRI